MAPGAKTTKPCRTALPNLSASARRVVVKAHYVKMSAYGRKAARLHLAYLEREGVEKDGSKGLAYGAEGPAVAADFAKPRPGERHQFRLIVSPEDAAELDMNDFVRRYMARVEKDLGQSLDWMAVNHFNTDNPHAHVVIRGVDREGAQVRLERAYIAHGLRARAQELVTEELGPRTERQIRKQKLREVTQDRLTGIDYDFARIAEDGRVELRSPRRRGVDEGLVLGRLEHLESLDLARRESANAWRLLPDWQQHLRALGREGDVLARMHRGLGRKIEPREILNPETPARDQVAPRVVYGRIVRKEIDDDKPNGYHLILDSVDGRGYYLAISSAEADKVREGELVALHWPRGRATDRSLSPSADRSRSQGVRDLSNSNSMAPQEKDRAERRGRRAGRSADGARIERQTLTLDQQVKHPGPVWLDRVDRAELGSAGFGAEVSRAIGARDEYLKSQGIAPDAPHRAARIRDLERRAAGERQSKEEGERFLPRTPSKFRGRVSVVRGPEGGASYAAVSDGRAFVVAPLTRELKRLDGKTVDLARSRQGRVLVVGRDPGKDRGR